MSKPMCCWLLSEPRKLPAEYCGKPTSYVMVFDDDRRRVRKYHHLCNEHREAAKKLPLDEEDESFTS